MLLKFTKKSEIVYFVKEAKDEYFIESKFKITLLGEEE